MTCNPNPMPFAGFDPNESISLMLRLQTGVYLQVLEAMMRMHALPRKSADGGVMPEVDTSGFELVGNRRPDPAYLLPGSGGHMFGYSDAEVWAARRRTRGASGVEDREWVQAGRPEFDES